MEVYLDHLKGERAGALDRFGKEVIRVGRHAEFELCFDDLGVSYEHAELRLRDGDFWLVDRGSTNGSYVNEERAYNARLKDGDVLRFGKKGPVVRFRVGAPPATGDPGQGISPAVLAAGQAAPTGSGGPPPFDLTVASALIKEASRKTAASDEPLADLPPLAPVALDAAGVPKKRSRRVTIPNLPTLEPEHVRRAPSPPMHAAPHAAKESDASSNGGSSSEGGSSDASSGASSALEARRAGERRISVSPRGPARGVYVALGALSLLAVFGSSAAVMFWMEADRKGREVDEYRHRADLAKKELDDFRKATTDQQREEQLTLLRQRDETARLVENLEKSLEHERKEGKRIEREGRQKIEDLQQELARAKGELAQLSNRANERPGDMRAWKMIQKRLTRSIVLVACSIKLKKPDGTSENFVCFGSGFFISKEGHIVTNKHVVEPWKFRPLALRLAQENLEPDLKTYQLAVWIAETRFASGQQLDVSTGYSTNMKTLEKVRTPRDVMTPVVNPGDKGPRNIMIHHESSNEDLALLKATGGPFEPIPLRRTSDGIIEKLDQVMVLGFPAGPAILEKGVAETSPSLGQVRKVEDTIYVNASMMGGNSGGPLVDTEGRVVGVATRIVNGTEALGICLKADHVIDLYDGGSW